MMSKQTVEDIYPLSPMQQGIWFHTLYAPDAALYCVQLTCTLHGALDTEAFAHAWSQVIARHPILRTGFVGQARQEPAQVVYRRVELPLTEQDWRKLPPREQQARLDVFCQTDRVRSFDLATPPLMRLALLRVADDCYHLVWSHHHILLDGWCIPLLLQEVFTHYTRVQSARVQPEGTGPQIQLERSRPYRDYIRWLKQQDLAAAERFWRAQLSDLAAPTALVVDRAATAQDSSMSVSKERHANLPAATTAALQNRARQHGLTLNTLLQGAWALLLSRYNGSEEVVFGVTVSGRPTDLPGAETMIGLFINTLPVRVSVPDDLPLVEWLQLLQQQQAAIRDYEYSPLPQIHRWSAVPQGEPLFESIVVFENYPVGDTLTREVAGLRITDVRSAEQTNYPLALVAAPGPELSLRLVYDTARFDAVTIERMMGHLQTLLAAMGEHLSTATYPVRRLPLLPTAEQQLLLREWAGVASAYPHGASVHELFAAQAAATPDAVALVFGDATLSYRELNERANGLAHHLQRLGVGLERPVGLCMERSLEMVIGTLAILKAGGAYLPLDPTYPAERLAFMLADAQPGVVLSQPGTQAAVTAALAAAQMPGVTTLALDSDMLASDELDSDKLLAQRSADNPVSAAGAENLAYIMYTSGSTGRPKGTCIRHRSVVRLVKETNFAKLGADEVWLQFAPISFDAATLELWGSLLNGGKLVLFPPHTPALAELGEIIRREGVTSLWLTAGLFHLMVDERLEDLRGVRQLLAGGDVLSVPHVRKVLTELPACTLINGYGPTENTTFTCCHPMTTVDAVGNSVSIGKPIANTEVYILDRQLRPVPVGVAGELYVGGAGLARAYLHRAALTAERFVPHPYSTEAGARLYRTGDLVRWLADGTIEFLGRGDTQVKVRGFRIELGEIETALVSHPAIRAGVVVARGNNGGGKQLVAYTVAEREPAPSAGELRQHLQGTLPDYMVPALFVMLDALPLNANGKVDRQALPAPEEAQTDDETYIAPRTPTEEQLATIWSQVLGVERVGIYDSFFELGGDSILSIQVIGKAGQQGLRLTPRQLFQHPTIAELASMAATMPAVQAEQGPITGPVPLTPIQHWFFAQDLPTPHHFNQTLLFAVDEPLDPQLLEVALQHLLLHHDALRLRFAQDATGWQQVNAASDEMSIFTQVDLASLPEAEQPAAIERHATSLQQSLDLRNGPLLRVALFDRGGGQSGRLLFVIHHLAVDGVSWRILLSDLAMLYGQLVHGKPTRLLPKTTSYQQWAQQLNRHAARATIQAQASDWVALLQRPTGPLPSDFPAGRQANTAESSATVTASLTVDETHALLHEVPEVYHTRIEDLLLTAVVQLFAEWKGEPGLLINLEGHGRESLAEDGGEAEIDLSRTVGWFTTIYPVYLSTGSQREPGRALKAIKEQLRAIPDKGMSYALLRYLADNSQASESQASESQASESQASESQASESQANSSLRQLRMLPEPEISFNYLGQLDQALPSELPLALVDEPVGPAQDPKGLRPHLLDISGRVVNGQLQIAWTYSRNLHRESTITQLAQRLLNELRKLISHCQTTDEGGYTTSDFPLASLDQAQLDRVTAHDSNIDDLYPLSAMQEGMLFATLLSPKSSVYINQVICDLSNLDVSALTAAWQGLIDRHAILRTAFVWQKLAEPLQMVRRHVTLPTTQHDWRDRTPAEQEAACQAFLAADRQRGFQPDTAPLMRITLLQLTDTNYRLIWTSHHLLLDGWTTSLLLKELLTLYAGAMQQQPVNLPVPHPYRNYIAWLQRQDMDAAATFWQQTLHGIIAPTPLRFAQPTNGNRPGPAKSDAIYKQRLSRETTAALQKVARTHDLTLNTILQGVWAMLLGHASGERDVLFGTTLSGRPTDLPGAESMIGIFINTLPVRVHLTPDAALVPWLRALQEHLSDVRHHEFSPLTQVQSWSAVPQEESLFESIVVFENYPTNTESLREFNLGLRIDNIDAVIHNNLPLTLRVVPGTELALELLYDTARFTPAVIEQLFNQIVALVARMVENPDVALAELFAHLRAIEGTQRAQAQTAFKSSRGQKLRTVRRKAVGAISSSTEVSS